MATTRRAPSWKGVRMVSDASGVTAGSTVTLVGSDDGKTFWMLNGKKSDGGKGGPKGLEATYDGTKLTFPDGNHWSLVPIPSSKVVAIDGPPTDELQGVFHDHGHYEEGTWKDVRMVTNATGVDSGSKVTLVGGDDGKAFWTLKGDAAGGGTKVSIDFSPKGVPKGLEASWDGAKLTFPDGNHWARVPGARATGIASYVWAALASVAVVGLGLLLKK